MLDGFHPIARSLHHKLLRAFVRLNYKVVQNEAELLRCLSASHVLQSDRQLVLLDIEFVRPEMKARRSEIKPAANSFRTDKVVRRSFFQKRLAFDQRTSAPELARLINGKCRHETCEQETGHNTADDATLVTVLPGEKETHAPPKENHISKNSLRI